MNNRVEFNAENTLINNKPLVSVITVVYNDVKNIEQTIISVINQTYSNVEYIIVDGGSTDGTVDIIKQYENRISYWVSEEDKGIYDAMNKGINLSNGTWVNFMNSGDKFVNYNVLENIKFHEYDNFVLLYGNKVFKGQDISPMSIDMLKKGVIMACHQTMFFNKSLLSKELYYDLSFPVYGDYELVNRFFLNYPSKIKYLDLNIADYQGGGISATPSLQKRMDKYRILYKHYGILGVIKGLLYRIGKCFV